MITFMELLHNQPGLALMTNAASAILTLVTASYWGLRWRKSTPALLKIGSRLTFLWSMAVCFALAILFSYKILILYLWYIAFLALKEFFSITPTRRADRRILLWAYLSLPIQFIFILMGWGQAFTLFVPIHVFLVLPMIMVISAPHISASHAAVLTSRAANQEREDAHDERAGAHSMISGETRGFLKAWSIMGWGIITTVYSLGHLAYLLVLPVAEQPTVGGSGLFLFLVGLAQLSYVAQFAFGKLFPDPRLSLKVSTTRNWASLLGSILVTTPVAWLVAPWLTPFTPGEAVLMGAIIAVSAFVGYIILSAIKNDLQLKDRGEMAPGRGGVLNRIDAFVYTAPLFYYLVVLWHY